MAKGRSDYFGLNRILSIILAIIPITAWICGMVTRLLEKKILAFIVRLLVLGFIIWIVDLILMIVKGKILRLLPI